MSGLFKILFFFLDILYYKQDLDMIVFLEHIFKKTTIIGVYVIHNSCKQTEMVWSRYQKKVQEIVYYLNLEYSQTK